MPIIQIDWQKIKSRLGDVTALYALTHRQASLLSSLAEQLKWEKTFRINDYDFSDKDELDADIADLELQLQMPTNLVDIIQYIDEIEDLLRALQGVTSCCDGEDITGGDQYTDPITDGEGDVPQNIIDAGYADDAEDWAGFASYKCMISHLMVLQIEYRLRKLATLADESGDILGGVAVITSVIVTIFTVVITGGLTAMALGILATTGTAAVLWKAITDATNLDDLADEVDENHDELACSIYGSDGSVDAIASLKSKIDELFTGSAAIILKNLNIDATLKALYSGGYGDQDIADIIATTGYSTDDFSCDCISSQYYQEYVFDYSLLGFVPSGASMDIRADLTGNLSAWLVSEPAWGYFYRTLAGFLTDIGETGPFRTVRVEFDYRFYTHLTKDFTADDRLSLYINTDTGYVDVWHKNFGDDGLGEDEWGHVILTGSDLGWWEGNDWLGSIPWQFRVYTLAEGHGTLCYELNNLQFWLDDGQD